MSRADINSEGNGPVLAGPGLFQQARLGIIYM